MSRSQPNPGSSRRRAGVVAAAVLAVSGALLAATPAIAAETPLSGADIWEFDAGPQRFGGTLDGVRYFRVQQSPASAYPGVRLWRTDGTPAGTGPVAGAPTGVTQVLTTSTRLIVIEGSRLWRGPATGPLTLVSELSSGIVWSGLRSEGDRVWLTAGAGSLYRFADSDVTPVPLGSPRTGFTAAAGAQYAAGYFYYRGFDAVADYELHRVDAATGQTSLVRDLTEGGSSTLDLLGATSDRVYFVRSVGATREFWSSDGTAAGTVQLSKDDPTTSNEIRSVHPVGERAFVVVGQFSPRLMVTTGSVLTPLAPIPGVGLTVSAPFTAEGVDWNGRLGLTIGGTLVVSDGTVAGTSARDGDYYWPRVSGARLVLAQRTYNDNGWSFTASRADRVHRVSALSSPPSIDSPWFVAGGRAIFAVSNPARTAARLTSIDTRRVEWLATPVITGAPRTGATLRVTRGAWDPAAAAVTYRWYVGGTPVAGATGPAYRVRASDRSKQIRVLVTATAPGHRAVSAWSTPVRAKGVFVAKRKPVLTGKARVGRTLRASAPKWSVGGVKVRYRWYAGGKPIRGATKRTYTIRKANRGKRISVRAVGSKATYVDRVVWSRKTVKVRRR